MTSTDRKALIRERHQARAGFGITAESLPPRLDELPEADVSDIVRTYQETEEINPYVQE